MQQDDGDMPGIQQFHKQSGVLPHPRNAETGQRIVDAARGWIDTPFRHQGRTKGVEVDCAGLAVGAAIACGLRVSDQAGYPRLPVADTLKSVIESQCEKIEAYEIGCLIYIADGPTLHLAIATRVNPLTIIHASAPDRKVIEQSMPEDMKRKPIKIYRFPTWRV